MESRDFVLLLPFLFFAITGIVFASTVCRLERVNHALSLAPPIDELFATILDLYQSARPESLISTASECSPQGVIFGSRPDFNELKSIVAST